MNLFEKATAIQDLLVQHMWSADVDHKWPTMKHNQHKDYVVQDQKHIVEICEMDNAIVILNNGVMLLTHKEYNDTNELVSVIDATYDADTTVQDIVGAFNAQFEFG